jgi:hypothetical protein
MEEVVCHPLRKTGKLHAELAADCSESEQSMGQCMSIRSADIIASGESSGNCFNVILRDIKIHEVWCFRVELKV